MPLLVIITIDDIIYTRSAKSPNYHSLFLKVVALVASTRMSKINNTIAI